MVGFLCLLCIGAFHTRENKGGSLRRVSLKIALLTYQCCSATLTCDELDYKLDACHRHTMVSGQWSVVCSGVCPALYGARPASVCVKCQSARPMCSVLSHYKSHDRQTQLPPVMSCYVMLCNVNSRACTFLQSELMKSPVCRLTGAFVLVVQLHYAH